MSTLISSLVHEVTTTAGAGAQTVAAVNARRTFNVAFGTGGSNVFYYAMLHRTANEWEYGTGHLSSATVLVRDTVIASSNANTTVTFTAGTIDVLNDLPAEFHLSEDDAVLLYQPLDTDLTSWAAVVRASGFDTFVATPSLANLGSLLTNEAAGAMTFLTTPTAANLATLVTDDLFSLADAELGAIAGLTSAADKFPYFSGSGTAALADLSSAMRTFLTTPSSANLAALISDDLFSLTDAELGAIAGLTSAADKGIYFTGSGTAALFDMSSAMRTFHTTPSSANLAALISDDLFSLADAELGAIAGLTSAADRVPYFTGLGTAALATFTATGRSIVDDASVTAVGQTLFGADPGADRIVFWDDDAGVFTYLTAGTNLTITGTTIDASGGGGTAASTTEVLTGTDTTKFVTADALAALWEKGTNVASAGTVSLGEGGFFHITGTTTITDIDFATAKDGRLAWVIFDGALTLTHNATTLILPGGANITTAAGDRALFIQDATDNVYCATYERATGLPLDADLVALATPGSLTAETAPAVGDKLVAVVDGGYKTIDFAYDSQLAAGYAHNAMIIAQRSAGAETWHLKTINSGGSSDPSTSDPIVFVEYDGTASLVTSAVTLTAPSGATLGMVNSEPSNLWFALANDGGTFRLAVAVLSDETGWTTFSSAGVMTATAISTSADVLKTVYSSAALSSDPYVWVGFMQYTLATVGTWNTTQSFNAFGPNVPRPGTEMQRVTGGSTATLSTASATYVTTSNQISIGLTNASNIVVGSGSVHASNGTGSQNIQCRWSRGTTSNTNMIGSVATVGYSAAATGISVDINFTDKPNTTSSTTYTIQGLRSGGATGNVDIFSTDGKMLVEVMG